MSRPTDDDVTAAVRALEEVRRMPGCPAYVAVILKSTAQLIRNLRPDLRFD